MPYQEGTIADGPNGALVFTGGRWMPMQQGLPSNPLKVQEAQGGIAKTAVDTQRTTQQISQDNALFDAKRKEADANATVAALKAQAQQQEQEQAAQQELLKSQADNLGNSEAMTAISRARGLTSGWSTGLGGQMLAKIGGTQARDLQTQLNTVAAAVTLKKLMDMKAQSQNGASGMGALSDREGAMLRDSVAGLDQFQSKDQFLNGLNAVEQHYRKLAAINSGGDPTQPGVQLQYGIDPAHREQQIAAKALQDQYRSYTAQTKNLPAMARQIGLQKLQNDPRMKRLWGIVNSGQAAGSQPSVVDFNDLP